MLGERSDRSNNRLVDGFVETDDIIHTQFTELTDFHPPPKAQLYRVTAPLDTP